MRQEAFLLRWVPAACVTDTAFTLNILTSSEQPGLRKRLPSAETFPLDPNHCLPRSSIHALSFLSASYNVLEEPRMIARSRWLREGVPGRPQGLPRANGLEPKGGWSELADETSCCPGTAATRGGGEDAATAGTDPGLQNAAPQSAIIRRPSPNLDTPANPGQHTALPRPENCSKTLRSTSTNKLGASLFVLASHKVDRRPGPECPAAAQGPPPPRSLHGVVRVREPASPAGVVVGPGQRGVLMRGSPLGRLPVRRCLCF